MRSALVITLAALAAATPAAEIRMSSGLGTPPKHKEFHVAFSVSTGSQEEYLTIAAVANGTMPRGVNPTLVLVGHAPSAAKGTPAYFNGTTDSSGGMTGALNFDLTGAKAPLIPGVYGAIVPQVGDGYGIAEDVLGYKGQEDNGWEAYNRTIGHTLQAALSAFYACSDTVNGKSSTVLKWGAPRTVGSSLVPPVNCQSTNLIRIFNVPGGAKPPSEA